MQQDHAHRHADYVIREAPSAAPHDPVLHRLVGIYSFWLVSLKGADNNSRRKSLRIAADSFRAKWGMLLPSEREELVDVLVSKYCLWQLDPTQVDLDQLVSYRHISESVKHPIASISKSMTENERAALATVARDAVRANPSSEVQAWYNQLFEDRDGGIRPIKLLRVRQDGWPILRGMLEHVSKRLLEGVPVAQALPPADLLFSTVHLALETPRDRRKIFKDRINDLLNMYASVQPPLLITPDQHHAYLGLVRTTFFWVAEDEHFEAHLSPTMQIAAVKLVRERLFDVCALFYSHGSVPALEPLVKELYRALGHAEASVRLALDPLSDHLPPPAQLISPPTRPRSPTYTWIEQNPHHDAHSLDKLIERRPHQRRRSAYSPYFSRSRIECM